MIRTKPIIFGVAALFLLSGCVTKNSLPKAPKNAPTIEQAQQTKVTNRAVRWGGEIIRVRNSTNQTEIEVLAKPLTSSGAPKTQSSSQGRFIAVSPKFIDPEDIKKGDYISVYGVLTEYSEKKIDAYRYQYPVVTIEQYKAWPKNFNRPRYHNNRYWRSRYYYDPFYFGGYYRGINRGFYRHSLYRGFHRHGLRRGFHHGY